MQTGFVQERVVERSPLLKERGKIDADGTWFVSVEAHYKILGSGLHLERVAIPKSKW
jgi:hypothetical protein